MALVGTFPVIVKSLRSSVSSSNNDTMTWTREMHCGDLMANGGAAYITMATSLRRQFVTIRWRVVPIWQTSIPQVLCTFQCQAPINLAYSKFYKLTFYVLCIPIEWICLLVN